ncbi:hypothetical protein N310_04087, partial [Acanthisitta chloris]
MAGPSRRRCIRAAFRALASRSVKRRRRRAFFSTKIPDTYHSYSEDSGCSVGVTRRKRQRRVKPLRMHIKPKARDLGDVSYSEASSQLPLAPVSSVLPESHSDLCMETGNDFPAAMEIASEETAVFPSEASDELSQKTRFSAEPWVLECPSPMETEPSGSVGFWSSFT